ncbi:ADP-heptose:LPS heptosyltransferase [Owenweeksia hongkongensis DSM 17368]|uniref:ADP-heptose:LPS heptosyltransferase n=1 Tax=Owenweeksia hongkongensis (strain DSM 17368 / CIP 108786 / JCM 12287 / NRRL B-23963 / UST20020801) TaxID=926562 RepID=G8R8R6_OWEHD|nr:glycosyltransferase family 9 protein [Owenweeksia hongkongensis]AEV32496.1 ADP-heptose:LPS heptosyltransferase [Owenweeksia hongkongensis DSM 17368]
MHLVVLRFSAIGDVALTVPVIAQIKQTYPEVKITVVTRGFLKSLFSAVDVNFLEADLNGRHKGFKGIKKLHSDIKKLNPDKIIDLHGVLRTHILKRFFSLNRIPFFSINKGREGKKELTRKENKVWKQQKHSTTRYAEVFAEAGFPINWKTESIPHLKYTNPKAEEVWAEIKTESTATIGIAPLTTFKGKTWPWEKVEELVQQLCEQQIQVVLFGGKGDKEILDKLTLNQTLVSNLAGKLPFDAEIALMKKLDAMVSMDSSNMHLATLAGTPVVSIWGATHTLAGFGPLGKNDHLIAEIPKEELDCRPCSVFGNKPCFRGDYACLNYLSSQSVLEKVILATKQKL